MPTECRGFSLIEVLVATAIFFMAMAAISGVFGNASQRLFKLKDMEKQLQSISQALADNDVEKETQSTEVKISYKDNGDGKAFLYDAEVEFTKFPECPKCPELVTDIIIKSEAEEK